MWLSFQSFSPLCLDVYLDLQCFNFISEDSDRLGILHKISFLEGGREGGRAKPVIVA